MSKPKKKPQPESDPTPPVLPDAAFQKLLLVKLGHLEARLESFEELILDSIRATDQRLAEKWEKELPKAYERRCNENLLHLFDSVKNAMEWECRLQKP
jgi:hypothetical protein